MTKIGRNDKCQCGSGKKYKRCHLRSDEEQSRVGNATAEAITPEVSVSLAAIQAEQDSLQKQGFYLPHIETEFQGKRVRAVGSRLYPRPLTETFHEFLIYLLMGTLGEAWVSSQKALLEQDRHFVVRCWDHFSEWKRRHATEKNREGAAFGAAPDGWSRSLIALAADVYALLHRGDLPPRLLNRLKDRNQYQGARYELAIAGMFVRVGCTIRWLDRSTSEPVARHCEFVARHEASGVAVAVEAKSRHRPGVLHVSGIADQAAVVKGDVKGLIERAMGQAPGDMPFIVFVDVNAPFADGSAERVLWMDDVGNIVRARGLGTPEESVPFNAIIVTNYSWHYATEAEADQVQFIAALAQHPRQPLPDPAILTNLRQGLENYGHVPDLE